MGSSAAVATATAVADVVAVPVAAPTPEAASAGTVRAAVAAFAVGSVRPVRSMGSGFSSSMIMASPGHVAPTFVPRRPRVGLSVVHARWMRAVRCTAHRHLLLLLVEVRFASPAVLPRVDPTSLTVLRLGGV